MDSEAKRSHLRHLQETFASLARKIQGEEERRSTSPSPSPRRTKDVSKPQRSRSASRKERGVRRSKTSAGAQDEIRRLELKCARLAECVVEERQGRETAEAALVKAQKRLAARASKSGAESVASVMSEVTALKIRVKEAVAELAIARGGAASEARRASAAEAELRAALRHCTALRDELSVAEKQLAKTQGKVATLTQRVHEYKASHSHSSGTQQYQDKGIQVQADSAQPTTQDSVQERTSRKKQTDVTQEGGSTNKIDLREVAGAPETDANASSTPHTTSKKNETPAPFLSFQDVVQHTPHIHPHASPTPTTTPGSTLHAQDVTTDSQLVLVPLTVLQKLMDTGRQSTPQGKSSMDNTAVPQSSPMDTSTTMPDRILDRILDALAENDEPTFLSLVKHADVKTKSLVLRLLQEYEARPPQVAPKDSVGTH